MYPHDLAAAFLAEAVARRQLALGLGGLVGLRLLHPVLDDLLFQLVSAHVPGVPASAQNRP
jgi:hypothetical protein